MNSSRTRTAPIGWAGAGARETVSATLPIRVNSGEDAPNICWSVLVQAAEGWSPIHGQGSRRSDDFQLRRDSSSFPQRTEMLEGVAW
ncbi:MAG: hypothetical protein H6969_01175 [Gammaproteobacteria bacterium]|nr:hypothetical protein [Gammaproteobacteria bacterium]